MNDHRRISRMEEIPTHERIRDEALREHDRNIAAAHRAALALSVSPPHHTESATAGAPKARGLENGRVDLTTDGRPRRDNVPGRTSAPRTVEK